MYSLCLPLGLQDLASGLGNETGVDLGSVSTGREFFEPMACIPSWDESCPAFQVDPPTIIALLGCVSAKGPPLEVANGISIGGKIEVGSQSGVAKHSKRTSKL